MKNIEALREHLFKQLEALEDPNTKPDFDRLRAVCAVADRIIDTARIEVQLAAVLKGALEVPFVEGQAGERPANDAQQIPLARQTPLERAAAALTGGPPANHPWRESLRRADK